ncbi:uncharacterized protein [Dermacentor albipictus]|uniref:uncharacterized protein isoform X4 n=1 Tax=Dermacentor albipictus TaxID=60249 RepID=UPI0038FC1A37
MVPTNKAARQNAKRKHQRATETEEEREERLSKRRAQYAARRQRATSSVETAEAKEEIMSLPDSDHAAQKFRTMKTKYKDLKRMHEVARAHGRPVTRPRWRYYELMDDFMRGRDETPRHSSAPVMVISNIYSVAEQSPAVAVTESEAPIVPELWPSEQSVSDGPEKKKIKQEPHYDEEVSWDTNDSIDDRVDGESLSSNQAQAQQHRAEATLENTADTSMASTSASPTAGSQQDAFHFFGMMVADRLRRLPRGAALRALNAMHQVLFEHEEEAGF